MAKASVPATQESRVVPGMDFDGEIHDVAQLDNHGDLGFQELMAQLDAGGISHIGDIDEQRKVEKDKLIGKAFILTSWKFRPGEYGPESDFAVCEITTKDNEKLLFTDGSTGIKDQLKTYERKLAKLGRPSVSPIYVPNGLMVSNYMWTDPSDGIAKPASTYYFSNES